MPGNIYVKIEVFDWMWNYLIEYRHQLAFIWKIDTIVVEVSMVGEPRKHD